MGSMESTVGMPRRPSLTGPTAELERFRLLAEARSRRSSASCLSLAWLSASWAIDSWPARVTTIRVAMSTKTAATAASPSPQITAQFHQSTAWLNSQHGGPRTGFQTPSRPSDVMRGVPKVAPPQLHCRMGAPNLAIGCLLPSESSIHMRSYGGPGACRVEIDRICSFEIAIMAFVLARRKPPFSRSKNILRPIHPCLGNNCHPSIRKGTQNLQKPSTAFATARCSALEPRIRMRPSRYLPVSHRQAHACC
jgi:hypothetical protein